MRLNPILRIIPKHLMSIKIIPSLKRAIERNLEIIGEAVSRILKFNKDIPISNARNIIGLRNQIIHSYDNISDEYLWGVIVKHLPVLKSEILNLIS